MSKLHVIRLPVASAVEPPLASIKLPSLSSTTELPDLPSLQLVTQLTPTLGSPLALQLPQRRVAAIFCPWTAATHCSWAAAVPSEWVGIVPNTCTVLYPCAEKTYKVWPVAVSRSWTRHVLQCSYSFFAAVPCSWDAPSLSCRSPYFVSPLCCCITQLLLGFLSLFLLSCSCHEFLCCRNRLSLRCSSPF